MSAVEQRVCVQLYLPSQSFEHTVWMIFCRLLSTILSKLSVQGLQGGCEQTGERWENWRGKNHHEGVFFS